MNAELIETGMIVNTHGIHGRLRLQPWADSPQQLADIDSIYIDGVPFKVLSAEVHKSCLLVSLDGIDSIESAMKLKGKVVCAKRADIALPEGTYFIADLIGLNAINAETGDVFGIITEILTPPANNVYVIKGIPGTDSEQREILIPAVEEFIIETNIKEGYVKFKLIDGL